MPPPHKKKSSAKATLPVGLILKLANESANPISVLPDFDAAEQHLQCDIGGDLHIRTKCFTWLQLSPELQNWIIDLTEKNMKDHYECSSWKWNRQAKLSELKHKTARHLVTFDQTDNPISFVHFRFEEGYSSDPVVYCYELQVEPKFWRCKIGSYLMDILQALATKYRMKKVILTVLKQNKMAFDFYVKGLQFKIDPNSPSCFQQEADYEILSKKPTEHRTDP